MTQASAFFGAAPGKRERARNRLMTAAVEAFGSRGLEGATVREIAAAAGQNVAAIAYYFGGKEALYHGVLEGIVREIKSRMGDLLAMADRLRRQPEPAREEAWRLLKAFLSEVYLRLLSRDDAVPIMRLVVREQLAPTAGFEVLYRQGFHELHQVLCFLVGTALGTDPRSRRTILRTHLLMGQVYFFAMSREAIQRRLGWNKLEGRNAALVVEMLDENLEALRAGLAQEPADSPGQEEVPRHEEPSTEELRWKRPKRLAPHPGSARSADAGHQR